MLKRAVSSVLAKGGFELNRRFDAESVELTHPDLEPEFREVYVRCAPYTMTSPERMYALYQAVNHVRAAGIPGAVVECGVWRGGSSMLAAATLLRAGDVDRDLWLYDTFQGMSEPGEEDVDITGQRMRDVWSRHRDDRDSPLLCFNSLEEVRANMASVGYPADRVHLITGKVEDTIPGAAPDRIAILRLDTDWYESTKHELDHLFPRIAPGGVLIVDDYGHWQGARQAVERYLSEHGITILLNRIDYTGRIAVKPSE